MSCGGRILLGISLNQILRSVLHPTSASQDGDNLKGEGAYEINGKGSKLPGGRNPVSPLHSSLSQTQSMAWHTGGA